MTNTTWESDRYGDAYCIEWVTKVRALDPRLKEVPDEILSFMWDDYSGKHWAGWLDVHSGSGEDFFKFLADPQGYPGPDGCGYYDDWKEWAQRVLTTPPAQSSTAS